MMSGILSVLLAEDSAEDIAAVERAWKRHNILNPLHVVRDGEECLDYLHKRGRYAPPANGQAPRPGILILDLKMPKMDGLAVLREIRENERLRHLPVIVLTTSRADEDRVRSYELWANAYITKPAGFAEFAEAIAKINGFWMLVELPD